LNSAQRVRLEHNTGRDIMQWVREGKGLEYQEHPIRRRGLREDRKKNPGLQDLDSLLLAKSAFYTDLDLS